MKETVLQFGGRGGGSKDMAQGGIPKVEELHNALTQVARKISEHTPS
jgi:alanyl-tRNA synthetase